MARSPIPPARIEAARQAFLSGKGLREIAAEIGISFRSLATASKNGGWAEQRQWKQNASALPEVIDAFEKRFEIFAAGSEERRKWLNDNLALLVERLSVDLATADLADLPAERKVVLLKLVIDSQRKIHEMTETQKADSLPTTHIRMFTGDSSETTRQLLKENDRLEAELKESRQELGECRKQLAECVNELNRNRNIEQIVRSQVERLFVAGPMPFGDPPPVGALSANADPPEADPADDNGRTLNSGRADKPE